MLILSRVLRKPTWGTCAGLILLAESATRTKKGGQELIGGLDVRVNRNHFGRQVESFHRDLSLPFLKDSNGMNPDQPYRCVFIRAPVVEKILPHQSGIQSDEADRDGTIVAPSKAPLDDVAKEAVKANVEVMATLSTKATSVENGHGHPGAEDIVAVRQGNVFGTSFHPELTEDPRIHTWWLEEILTSIERRRQLA